VAEPQCYHDTGYGAAPRCGAPAAAGRPRRRWRRRQNLL